MQAKETNACHCWGTCSNEITITLSFSGSNTTACMLVDIMYKVMLLHSRIKTKEKGGGREQDASDIHVLIGTKGVNAFFFHFSFLYLFACQSFSVNHLNTNNNKLVIEIHRPCIYYENAIRQQAHVLLHCLLTIYPLPPLQAMTPIPPILLILPRLHLHVPAQSKRQHNHHLQAISLYSRQSMATIIIIIIIIYYLQQQITITKNPARRIMRSTRTASETLMIPYQDNHPHPHLRPLIRL